jgi:hypothetical protein
LEGSREHGNETSGSVKCWNFLSSPQLAASEEGLVSSMKFVRTCSLNRITPFRLHSAILSALSRLSECLRWTAGSDVQHSVH